MLTDVLRRRLQRRTHALAQCLLAHSVKPWHVTLVAPLTAWFVILPLLALRLVLVAAIIAIVILPLDAIDGAMARLSDVVTRRGTFADMLADRLSDSGVWAGVLIYEAREGQRTTLVLCAFAALGWGLLSHTTASARAASLPISLGTFQRTERLILLLMGIILTAFIGEMALVLTAWVLIIGSVLSFAQRLASALKMPISRFADSDISDDSVIVDRSSQHPDSSRTVNRRPMAQLSRFPRMRRQLGSSSTAQHRGFVARTISKESVNHMAVTEQLVQEARDVGRQIGSLMLADERMLATGVGLLGTASLLAIANGKPQTLTALPFALSLLFCFVEYQHSNVLALGGYKSVLEEAIALRLGAPVPAWESAIAPHLHRDRAIMMVRTLVVIFYVVSIGIALYELRGITKQGHWGHDHAMLYSVLIIGSILVGSAACMVAERSATRQYARVAQITRRELLNLWIADLA